MLNEHIWTLERIDSNVKAIGKWIEKVDRLIPTLVEQEGLARNSHDVTTSVQTNADRIRSMTDEEMAAFLEPHCVDNICELFCGADGDCRAFNSSTETSEQACRRIILEKLKQPYKEGV